MFRYLVRRLLQMALAFIGTTLIVFALMFAGGEGDPIQNLAGEKPVSAAQRAYLTEQFHLDDPFFTRYFYYLKNILTLNFGNTFNGRPIGDILATAWPITLKLGAVALTVTVIFGITAGVISGVRRGGLFDNSTLLLTLLIIGIPTVVSAPILQLVFGIKLGWFPAVATPVEPTLYQLILPGIVLGLLSVATAMRLTRASVAENLRSDFVRTAKSKGISKQRVIGIHVLRNSLIPIVTFIGVDVGSLMGGAIITESVYNVTGVGFYLRQGLAIGDSPLVISLVSLLVLVFLVVNLIVDLLYAVLDPRIRYE